MVWLYVKTHTLTLNGKYVFCEYMQMRGVKMESETHVHADAQENFLACAKISRQCKN